MPNEPTEPTTDQPAPAPDPERARFLVHNVARIARLLTDQMLQELQAPGSTDSPSLTDRIMLGALRPWMPKLQAALLDKLSEIEGANLERHLGAIASSIDELLTAAPGSPAPRMVYRWDGEGLILEPCPTCG